METVYVIEWKKDQRRKREDEMEHKRKCNGRQKEGEWKGGVKENDELIKGAV